LIYEKNSNKEGVIWLNVHVLSGSAFAQQVKAIFIEWQDFATLTFYSIPCDQFRSQFEETKETKKIVDKASIAKYLTQTKFFSIEKGIEQLGFPV
jgi:hypothetical protein